MKLNYKSDFAILLRFVDSEGEAILCPDIDIKVHLSTNGYGKYTALRTCDVWRNLHPHPEGLMIVADSHSLSPGLLSLNVILEIPNDLYPDGFEHIETPVATDIVLSKEATESADIVTVDVHIPRLDNYDTLSPLIPIATEEDIDKAFDEIFNTQN